MSEYFLKLRQTTELAEAAAVIQYIMASPSRQAILQTKYIQILKTRAAEGFTADSGDYSNEERDRTRGVANELTLDQILDDPRRGQGGKY